jgi:hypothetical protein
MATCRYCHESGDDRTMLKYSTRANVHAACFLDRPAKNFGRFIAQVSNLYDFPILMIRDDVPKLEALREAYKARNYSEAYVEICNDMIAQRIEELVEKNRKTDRWTD